MDAPDQVIKSPANRPWRAPRGKSKRDGTSILLAEKQSEYTGQLLTPLKSLGKSRSPDG